jgi:hypothetical protein
LVCCIDPLASPEQCSKTPFLHIWLPAQFTQALLM